MGAIYLTIQKEIRQKIESGEYEVGQTIPTEMELAEMYQVSRPTIRQAIQGLVDEGLLEKRKKRGTIVCQAKIDQSFTQAIDSFDSQVTQKGRTGQTKVLLFQKEKADREVRSILKSEWVFKLIRLRFVDNVPNVYVITYMPYEPFREFETVDFNHASFYELCKKYGHPIAMVQRHMEIALADDTLAQLLHIRPKEAVFYFRTIGTDPEGMPVEYSLSKYRSDTNTFSFTLVNQHNE